MKKRWYRNSGIKGLLVFLAIITLTAVFVCGEATAWLLRNGIWVGDSTKYIDSKSFADEVFMRSHTILDSIKQAELLEENSEDQMVDLGELVADSTAGISYRLGDLCKWSQESWDTAANVLICQKPDGSDFYMYYKELASQINSGELQFKFEDGESANEFGQDGILAVLSNRDFLQDG